MSNLPVLLAGPALAPRQETVDCPELGGAVICRGLLASEAFAVGALRAQALRTLRIAQADYRDRLKALPADTPQPDFESPDASFTELRAYGQYLTQLLACGVVTPSGMGLYSVDQWEVAHQHHPAMVDRLQAIVERLSGLLAAEDVRKNSTPTPT